MARSVRHVEIHIVHLKSHFALRVVTSARVMNERERKQHILFVCTVNRMRSATAYEIYKDDPRFEVDSAGTDKTANVVLEEWHLEWADAIVVMEKHHRNKIRERFPTLYERKPIVCLYIEDIYDFMQPELIAILREKFEDVQRRGLL